MLRDSEVSTNTNQREAFFLEFSEQIKKGLYNHNYLNFEVIKLHNKLKIFKGLKSTPILLTGGFRTLEGMNHALEIEAVDMIGMARYINEIK